MSRVEAGTLACLRIQPCIFFSIVYTLVPVHYSFTKETYGFISIDSQHCLWGRGKKKKSKVHWLATDNSTLSLSFSLSVCQGFRLVYVHLSLRTCLTLCIASWPSSRGLLFLPVFHSFFLRVPVSSLLLLVHSFFSPFRLICFLLLLLLLFLLPPSLPISGHFL